MESILSLKSEKITPPGKFLLVASGKGGVGKTWFSITLAHALAARGKRVLLFDGDLGLANIDIQLGIMPKFDIGNVVAGQHKLQEVIYASELGFDIVPGRSGSPTLANLLPEKMISLRKSVEALSSSYAHVIIDLSAGIGDYAQGFAQLPSKCLVMVTDEPTSLTDAYAFIKIYRQQASDVFFNVVVNNVSSLAEGERVFLTLQKACQEFLNFSPPLAGIIRRDTRVNESIRAQTSMRTLFPNSAAVADIEAIGDKIIEESLPRAYPH